MAIFFLVVAACIWLVFLRPVMVRTAGGTIVKKTHKPAGTYWQYQAGDRKGFWTPTPIPIAEAMVFEIRVDGQQGSAFMSMNTTAAEAFQVGQNVQITYEERSVPFLWKRWYVLTMVAG
jgi:hypothetical protein